MALTIAKNYGSNNQAIYPMADQWAELTNNVQRRICHMSADVHQNVIYPERISTRPISGYAVLWTHADEKKCNNSKQQHELQSNPLTILLHKVKYAVLLNIRDAFLQSCKWTPLSWNKLCEILANTRRYHNPNQWNARFLFWSFV